MVTPLSRSFLFIVMALVYVGKNLRFLPDILSRLAMLARVS